MYAFAGYMTVYNYYAYPDRIRPRIRLVKFCIYSFIQMQLNELQEEKQTSFLESKQLTTNAIPI